MLERQLPALNWATRSSPTDIHDKLLPWGLCNCPPRLCDIPTYVSPVLPGALWEDLVDSSVVQSWCTHASGHERRLSGKIRLHSCNLPFSDEDDCSFPILGALLRVTGLVAECLNHSLCTASPYPLPPTTPRPCSTSHRHMCPLWNGNAAPLKTVNLKLITAALMLM